MILWVDIYIRQRRGVVGVPSGINQVTERVSGILIFELKEEIRRKKREEKSYTELKFFSEREKATQIYQR